MKQKLRVIVILIMVLALGVSLLPVQQIRAAEANKYLVLVRENDGTYVMYDNLIFETKNKNLLIKAKLIAEALNLTYKEYVGNKKGFSIESGKDRLVFTRGSKEYIFYQSTTAIKRKALFKECYVKSYEMIHYKALSDLVHCSYYASNKAKEYKSLGYSGVIVYDYNNSNPTLPKVTELFRTMVKPEVYPAYMGKDIILASYSIQDGPGKLTLDLSTVKDTYKKNNLPNGGVYGFGYCEGDITIEAISSSGTSLGKTTTTGAEFLLDFPGAQQIVIAGEVKNLKISFTPKKPIVITDTVSFATADIDWLSPDGYARQYFVLPPHTQFNFYNYVVQTPYAPYRQSLNFDDTDTEDFSSGYQMLALSFYRDLEELCADTYCGVEFRVVEKVINRSNVIVYDTKVNSEAANYETELLKMIEGLKNVGLNKYFPGSVWDTTLNIRIKDGAESGGIDCVSIQPGDTDLNETDDYYVHLHEMTHFYEFQMGGYGTNINAWVEGNAISLSRLAFKKLGLEENGRYDQYNTDWSFLTEADKKDFENYYLTVSDWNAYITGYHFNCYLRENYGDDVIYRILQKAAAANIPVNQGITEERSKQFAKCIKAETSADVFDKFVKEYIVK